MVQSVKKLIEMIPSYKQVKFYSEATGNFVAIEHDHVIDRLKSELPTRLYNVADHPPEILIFGHPLEGDLC